jgi:hypothetical protein
MDPPLERNGTPFENSLVKSKLRRRFETVVDMPALRTVDQLQYALDAPHRPERTPSESETEWNDRQDTWVKAWGGNPKRPHNENSNRKVWWKNKKRLYKELEGQALSKGLQRYVGPNPTLVMDTAAAPASGDSEAPDEPAAASAERAATSSNDPTMLAWCDPTAPASGEVAAPGAASARDVAMAHAAGGVAPEPPRELSKPRGRVPLVGGAKCSWGGEEGWLKADGSQHIVERNPGRKLQAAQLRSACVGIDSEALLVETAQRDDKRFRWSGSTAVVEMELPYEFRATSHSQPGLSHLPSWNDARQWGISETAHSHRVFAVFRSGAYWAKVEELVGADESMSLDEFKYHMREFYQSTMQSFFDQFAQEQRTLDSERMAQRLELKQMRSEDALLKARDIAARKAADLAYQRRVDALFARMRDDDDFWCNGEEGRVGSTQHMPGQRFHPTRPPFWNDAEFATWRRGLAGEMWIGEMCPRCFETKRFGAERQAQVRESREAERLQSLENEVFQCEHTILVMLPRCHFARCHLKFRAVLPEGWEHAKFDEWRRDLVRNTGTLGGMALCPRHWCERT